MSHEVSGGHSFEYWICGAQGLEYLQEGLCGSVGDKALEYRNSRIAIITKGRITQCNECNSSNLLPEHANPSEACQKRTCIHTYANKCFGCSKWNNDNSRRKCPNGICSKLYDTIVLDHCKQDPLLQNTDPAKWCTDKWSIAKCFENYESPGKTAQKTDASGLLSILINNKYMNDWLDVSSPDHPVYQAKYIRNEILHKPKLELDDKSLNNYIDIFISVLKCLESNRGDQNDAILKLQQLRKPVTISEEYKQVCKTLEKIEKMIRYTKQSGIPDIELYSTKRQLERRKELLVLGKGKYPMPTFSRPHDGRLLILENEQVNGLMCNCKSDVIKGGYGVVSTSKDKVPGLDVRVVIKKITCEGNDMIKRLSVSKEKVASRTMHYAIVPLIAFMCNDICGKEKEDKSEFYFVSPYLERGNLLQMISKDKDDGRKEEYIMLNQTRRKQILFQIASALNFLHTPVPDVRGPILHRDLTTKNIVLDEKLNARLIDFGIAHEMTEKQTEKSLTTSCLIGTPGYHQTTDYSKQTVRDDCYSFGVVIRELLTGTEPHQQSGNSVIQLKYQSEFTVEHSVQKHIWKDKENASELIRLSTKCLDRENKEVTSVDLVDQIKTMCECQWSRVRDSKCDLCMVNDAAPSKHHHHRCSMNVCVSCMRNSHVNTIKCPTCNEDVIPKIGHTYAAILIAGNDIRNKEAAQSFSKEVKEIKDVLVSKYPCVIGIRDENIEMIIPSDPGKAAELLPKCRSAFVSLKSKRNLDTLLIYFTGHHSTENGFQLGGPTDNLTLAQLQENLKSISRAWGNTPRILAFLDCCYPQSMVPILNLSIDDLKVMQINAGRRFEKVSQPLSGSHFQRFFIQALTRRVFNKRCHSNATDCQYCLISGDFIDVDQLLKYISQHMNNCLGGNEPVSYSDGITWNDKIVGYNIDFIVDLIFTLDLGSEKGKTVSIEREVYCDMKMLKERIVQTVHSTYGVNGELTVTSVEFADALALRIQTGSKHGTELETVLKVSIAFDARREIIASYRTEDDILKGRVVKFMPTGFISHYISYLRSFYKPDRINEFEGKEVARFTLEELQNVIGEPTLNSGEEGTQFRNILLKVQDKWTYKKGDQQKKELQVIFPQRTENERHEYFVMDLTD